MSQHVYDKQPDFIKSTEEQSILDSLIQVAAYLQKLQPIDNMVGITDREKFLHYLPAKNPHLNLGDIRGMAVPKGDAIYEAVHSGKEVYIKVPKEVFGVPFKAVGVPVRDKSGKIIGGLGIGISLESQEKLSDMVQNVAALTEQTSSAIEEINSTVQHLAERQSELLKVYEAMQKNIDKTGSILEFVNDVAGTSNLLGLNAAIEAARAGEHGRGFSVVAEQIRKMSANSSSAVREAKEILNEIAKLIQTMSDDVSDVSTIGHELSTSIQQITDGTQHLATLSVELGNFVDII